MPKRPLSSDNDSELPVQKSKIDMQELVKQCRLQHGESILKCKFNKKRVRMLTDVDEFPQDACGGVLYWMVRDQRLQGNLFFFIYLFIYMMKISFVFFPINLSIFHKVVLKAWISLILSHHLSLSIIILGKSFGQHPMSAWSWCKILLVGWHQCVHV